MTERIIWILTVSLILCVFNGVSERQHNNCVSWRDDLLTLTITCRVPNFSEPITISHEKSKTVVSCSIAPDNPSCYPLEKNITVDRHNHTVCIQYIEYKRYAPLEGKWQCKQGNSVLYTNVSFSEGIISDSWVQIKGKISSYNDKRNDIIVECSSCRKPESSYVEFLVNNKSIGSILQNKTEGVCKYKLKKCNSVTCNCSSSENMFSLRLPLTDDIKEIACEMHFKDELRKGKYSTSASMKITGEDVIFGEPITNVIVKNEYKLASVKYSNPVTSEKPMTNMTSNTNHRSKELPTTLIIVIIVCTISLMIGLMIFLKLQYRLQKRKENNRKTKDTNRIKNPERKESLSSTNEGEKLIKDRKEEPCETCQGTINDSRYFCLNCNKKICSECYDIHVRFPVIKTHVIVKLEDLPVDFSLPVFCYKHTDDELKFVCITEGKLICKKCKDSGHDRCASESLNTHNVSKDDYYLFKVSVMKRLRTLEFYEDSLNLKEIIESKMIPGIQGAETAIDTAVLLEEGVPSKIKDSDSKNMKELLSTIRNILRNLDFIENINNLDLRLFNIHFYMSKEKIRQVKTTMKVIKGNLSGGGLLPFETFDEKGKNDIKNKHIKNVSRRNTLN